MSKIKMKLIALGLVIIVSAILFFILELTIKTAKRGRLEERFASLVQEIDTRCEATEFSVQKDNDWVEEYNWYSTSLAHYVSVIDQRNFTFAAVYTDDFAIISDRSEIFTDQLFDPLAYPEIVRLLKTEKSGIQDVIFPVLINGKIENRPERVYFRKVPIDYEDDYLIIIVSFAFTDDNVELQPYLLRLLYLVFGLAAGSFGILIFIVTHFIFVYERDHIDFRKKWGLE